MEFKDLGFSEKEADIFKKEGITADEVKEIIDEIQGANKTEGKKFVPSNDVEGKMIFWKIVDDDKDLIANTKKVMKEQGYSSIKEEKRNDGKIMLTSEKIVRKEEAEGLTIDPTDGIHQERDIKAGKKVKAVFYNWGEYFDDENDFDLDDLTGMEKLSGDDLMGCNIRSEDEDKVFYAEPNDIDREEREGEGGVGIKRMYGFDEKDLVEIEAKYGEKKGKGKGKGMPDGGRRNKNEDDCTEGGPGKGKGEGEGRGKGKGRKTPDIKSDVKSIDLKEGDRVKFQLKDTPLEDFVDVTAEPGKEQDELLKHYDGMTGKVKTIIGDPEETLYLTVEMEDGGILKDVSSYNFVKAAGRLWEQVESKEELPEGAPSYKYMAEDEEWHEVKVLEEVPDGMELYQYEITAAQVEAKRIEAKNRNLAYSMELIEHLPKKYNNFERVFNAKKGTITWVRGDMVIAFTPFWDGFAGIPFEVINGYTNEEIKEGAAEFEKTDNIKVDAAKYLIKFDEIMGDFNKHPRIIAALTADREAQFGSDSFEVKATNESGLDPLSEEIIKKLNDRGIQTGDRVKEVIKDQVNYILLNKKVNDLSIQAEYRVADDGAKVAIDLPDIVMTAEDRKLHDEGKLEEAALKMGKIYTRSELKDQGFGLGDEAGIDEMFKESKDGTDHFFIKKTDDKFIYDGWGMAMGAKKKEKKKEEKKEDKEEKKLGAILKRKIKEYLDYGYTWGGEEELEKILKEEKYDPAELTALMAEEMTQAEQSWIDSDDEDKRDQYDTHDEVIGMIKDIESKI